MNREPHFGDGLPDEPSKAKLNSGVVWMLMLLPIGLALGTVWGLYQHFSQREVLANKASKSISKDEIRQIMENYGLRFGDRDFDHASGLETLKKVTKNISGELQSNNSMLLSGQDNGNFEAGGQLWKSYWADVVGVKDEKVFFVATSYDGKQSLGNAAKMAILITVAKSLAGAELDYTLRFVFTPNQKPLDQQLKSLNQNCLLPSEVNVGTFVLNHRADASADGQQNTWKVTQGDVSWAQELMKGTRVMHPGIANLQHSSLDPDKPYDPSQIETVERAAKGLREILFLVLGADR